jgi:hypothetical protein
LFFQFVAVGFGASPTSPALDVGANSARILGNDVDFALWLLRMGASKANRCQSR